MEEYCVGGCGAEFMADTAASAAVCDDAWDATFHNDGV